MYGATTRRSRAPILLSVSNTLSDSPLIWLLEVKCIGIIHTAYREWNQRYTPLVLQPYERLLYLSVTQYDCQKFNSPPEESMTLQTRGKTVGAITYNVMEHNNFAVVIKPCFFPGL